MIEILSNLGSLFKLNQISMPGWKYPGGEEGGWVEGVGHFLYVSVHICSHSKGVILSALRLFEIKNIVHIKGMYNCS